MYADILSFFHFTNTVLISSQASMDIQPGFYVIVRDIIGIDNIFATRVGIDLPILGRSNQSNATENQRVCLYICRF